MSGTQVRQLVRLRALRRDMSREALVRARAARDEALAALAEREAGEVRAQAELLGERHALAADPVAADHRIAMVDRRRFAEAVAAERRLDAEREASEAQYKEQVARAEMIAAQRRHDAAALQADRLARAEAILAEEREALEMEVTRR